MQSLKKVSDLPEAQQKALLAILKMNKPAFKTSDVHKKLSTYMNGRSVGAVLGALYRNKYLDKIQGGRDKMWKLYDGTEIFRDEIKMQINKVKQYWS